MYILIKFSSRIEGNAKEWNSYILSIKKDFHFSITIFKEIQRSTYKRGLLGDQRHKKRPTPNFK